MTININEDVLWLDISVHNILCMQVLEAEEQLRKVESSLILSKFLNLA